MPAGASLPLRLSARSPYRPAPRKPMLAQLVQVSPQVDAPINIGFGSLPIVLGSFGGAVASVILGAYVPSIQGVTTIVAVGLGGFGVYNLLVNRGLIDTIPGGGEAPGAVSNPVGGAGASAPIASSPASAIDGVAGRVISPTEFQTVDNSPFNSTVPVRVRLSNPSGQGVTFDLVFIVNEIPFPFESGEKTNTMSTRVSLGAGETRDVDVPINLVTWGWTANQVDVYLTVQKRTIAGGSTSLLDVRHFVVD
jgi:hypothetical protein